MAGSAATQQPASRWCSRRLLGTPGVCGLAVAPAIGLPLWKSSGRMKVKTSRSSCAPKSSASAIPQPNTSNWRGVMPRGLCLVQAHACSHPVFFTIAVTYTTATITLNSVAPVHEHPRLTQVAPHVRPNMDT
eukprot:6472783-Amphidinium_carterae.1